MTPKTEQSNKLSARAARRPSSPLETHNDRILSVRDYFSGKMIFEVPYYQRGYKWSLLRHPEGRTHLEKLLADLKDSFTAFTGNEKEVYHLQGVTVRETCSESEARVELVDGQQRTTSLFLLLLWAKQRGIGVDEIDSLIWTDRDSRRLRLLYGVRKNVNEWIVQRDRGEIPTFDSTFQDICAFERAWNTIEKELDQYPVAGKELGFINFVLDQVKLIYVRLNTEQPTKVFSMMNQDRAVMTRTDLVKAKLLSEASREALQVAEHDDLGSNEWQINHLRSHFARSWDAWRKWWEDKAHSRFWNQAIPEFSEEPPLSRLLRLYWSRQAQAPGFNKHLKSRIPNLDRTEPTADFLLAAFGVFIQEYENPGAPQCGAVETFEGLRKLQQILEEWFEDPEIYNWLGLLFHGTSCAKKDALLFLLDWYERKKTRFCEECLRPLYEAASLWQFLPAECAQTPDTLLRASLNREKRDRAVTALIAEFRAGDTYHEAYEVAAQQLLRCNVQRLIRFRLKFDFNMYERPANNEMRSLEHIHSQSHFSDSAHSEVDGFVADGEAIGARVGNSIGNLVLLPKGLNSSLKNWGFAEKRAAVQQALLRGEAKRTNMALWLHSLEIFIAHQKWGACKIESNNRAFLDDLKKFYGLERHL